MADHNARSRGATARSARLLPLIAVLLGACSAEPAPEASSTSAHASGSASASSPSASGQASSSVTPTTSTKTPKLTVSTVADNLTNPWGLAALPGGSMLLAERPGRLSVLSSDGQVQQVSVDLGVRAVGEGGLLDVAVSPDFESNRTAWVCLNSDAGDVRVVPIKLAADLRSASVGKPLVRGLPANSSGRHSGCRLLVGPDKMLWIGTGDAAQPRNPQDLNSLGGKVLRVDPTTGKPPRDNPFADSSDAAKSLVYTYGHRNVQGLAIQPGTHRVWSVEHGSDVNDEVNLLSAGANYGWNPASASTSNYVEAGVPMTDTSLPNVREAVWSSGSSTIATSGGVFLSGSQWGSWQGRMVVAALKGQEAVVLRFDSSNKLVSQQRIPELNGHGRLRTVVLAPDGSLLVTTSNGSNDAVLRVTAE